MRKTAVAARWFEKDVLTTTEEHLVSLVNLLVFIWACLYITLTSFQSWQVPVHIHLQIHTSKCKMCHGGFPGLPKHVTSGPSRLSLTTVIDVNPVHLDLYAWKPEQLCSIAMRPNISEQAVRPWLMLGRHKTEVSDGAHAKPRWPNYSCRAINTLGGVSGGRYP